MAHILSPARMTSAQNHITETSVANQGKIQLLLTIVCPPEHADEGRRIFESHGPWMESTHHREGNKALLSYDVSIGPELSNPMDADSEPTGRTVFILNEIYESEDGVRDHFEQATSTWAGFPALGQWLEHCEISGVLAAPIVNSLW